MNERQLRTALQKFQTKAVVPASKFTSDQRIVLDQFARQTGAVSRQRQGRGDVYLINDQAGFDQHLTALSPQTANPISLALPLRAQHIAKTRNSKAGAHQHNSYYPLLKAIGDVVWNDSEQGTELALGKCTQSFGAATICIHQDDAWHTNQPLWLIENQALFDRTDWLPEGVVATLLYYGGQLDGRLLSWLSYRARASHIVFFPDYDGVGLDNFSRLFAALGGQCEFWLMPDWKGKLERYGSNRLWQDTLKYLTSIEDRLPAYMHELTSHMRSSALALEQEAVWLMVAE